MTLPPASARDRSLPAPAEVANTYIDVARRASRLLRRYARKTARKGIRFPSEEFEVARAFMDLSARLLASPYRMAQTQMEMMRDHISLWQQSTLRTMGMPFEAVATPDADDARFDDQAWKDDFLFDFIKQSYLITARHLQQTVAMAEGLDDATQREVNTRTRQYIDALSPTNFAFTNPEVLRETVDSKGKNLVKGLKHLLKDLMAGDDGHLCRVLAGGDAPRLGETLAASPGKVPSRGRPAGSASASIARWPWLPTRLAKAPMTCGWPGQVARPWTIAPKVWAMAEASITARTGRSKVRARSAPEGVPSYRPITPSTSSRSASRAASASSCRQWASPPIHRSRLWTGAPDAAPRIIGSR